MIYFIFWYLNCLVKAIVSAESAAATPTAIKTSSKMDSYDWK